MQLFRSYFMTALRSSAPEEGDEQRRMRALQVYKRVEQQLVRVLREKDKCVRKYCRYLNSYNSEALLHISFQLADLATREEAYRRIIPNSLTSTNRFVFSSNMLLESFEYVTQTQDEWLHFIEGIDVDGVAIGTHISHLGLAEQSTVGATADRQAIHSMILNAHESGHRIVAMIHSQPGYGEGATKYSGTDKETQRLWEMVTPMIGGIWSRSGHLRWFSHSLPFSVEIEGNHIERLNDRVFRIKESEEENTL